MNDEFSSSQPVARRAKRTQGVAQTETYTAGSSVTSSTPVEPVVEQTETVVERRQPVVETSRTTTAQAFSQPTGEASIGDQRLPDSATGDPRDGAAQDIDTHAAQRNAAADPRLDTSTTGVDADFEPGVSPIDTPLTTDQVERIDTAYKKVVTPAAAEGDTVDFDDNGGYGNAGGYGERLSAPTEDAGGNARGVFAGFTWIIALILIVGIALVLYFTL